MMANRNCDITLILPAFNEAGTIVTTLGEVTEYFQRRGWRYDIVVAADGDDGTRERAREFAQSDPAVRVIALASGSIIGFADADNKVPIGEFDKLEPWLRQDFHMVIGSRALERSLVERKQRWYRRLGSRGFYYFMHAIVGMPGIEDTQCGFKFFHADVARDLFSRQRIDGYMFDIEILALAQRIGYRIKEVPIRWRDDADSRLQLFSGNVRNAIDVFRIRAALGRQVRSRAAASPAQALAAADPQYTREDH
jgi:dolichyl-phosphate beta-glucosyltransferase